MTKLSSRDIKKIIGAVTTVIAMGGAYLAKEEVSLPFLHKSNETPSKTVNQGSTSNQDKTELNQKEFKSGMAIKEDVNSGKSTLNPSEWVGPKITYSPLDSENRVGAATAYLTKENYGKSEGREGQKWSPTGWHNQALKVNGKRVFPQNRGHLIGYTMTFNLDSDGNKKTGELGSIDNPKNLFSQSAYSNQVTFQTYEEMVRTSIKKGSKVTYRVEPIFKDNELMARGLWAQAVSDTGDLNFNVYIYNVQPGVEFNYSTGTSKASPNFEVK